MRSLKAVREHFGTYHLKAGIFHFYRGEHGPAVDFFSKALEHDNLNPAERRAALYYLVQTRIGAAERFESKEELDRAIAEYRKALEVIPSYPDVQLRLGRAFRRRGHGEDAVHHIERALEINGQYVAAWVELGLARLDEADGPRAKEAFRQAQRAREQRAWSELQGAEEALDSGDLDDAKDIYRHVFQQDLSSFQDLFRQGLKFLRAERWEDAAGKLDEASRICPRFADVQNYLGVALAEQRRHEEALLSLRRSVSINPEYLVAWLNLAYVAHACGRTDEAQTAVDRVLAREPDNAPALHLKRALNDEAAPRSANKPLSGSR
jgi:tetratricopeptide (TPR) repeat protein